MKIVAMSGLVSSSIYMSTIIFGMSGILEEYQFILTYTYQLSYIILLLSIILLNKNVISNLNVIYNRKKISSNNFGSYREKYGSSELILKFEEILFKNRFRSRIINIIFGSIISGIISFFVLIFLYISILFVIFIVATLYKIYSSGSIYMYEEGNIIDNFIEYIYGALEMMGTTYSLVFFILIYIMVVYNFYFNNNNNNSYEV